MLEVSGLAVRYDSTLAVRGIDLRVGPNEAVALLGPNGAGKSSTLRALSGLVRSGGRVMFDGRDLGGLAAEQIARLGLIHVPEGRHVFPTLTVAENLKMGLSAACRRQGEYSLADVLDLFPQLSSLMERSGYALSGGEQQMVAIGRALLAAPRLILLDEPSLGLAPILASAVFQTLRAISERTPVMVVEQNTQLALGMCDRAYVLVEGAVQIEGAARDLRDRDALMASFLGVGDVARR